MQLEQMQPLLLRLLLLLLLLLLNEPMRPARLNTLSNPSARPHEPCRAPTARV
jgi:hypothetical protein